MSNSFQLEVVTPKGRVVQVETAQVVAPGVLGELGALPMHRPALVQLGGGSIRYDQGEVFVRGGVAEIRPEKILVLADEAVLAQDADRARAEKILAAAQEALNAPEYVEDDALGQANIDLAYAQALLKATAH